jgi:hypothetical protein
MHCRQFWDFPAFPVFPAERLVWQRKRNPYRVGLGTAQQKHNITSVMFATAGYEARSSQSCS